MWYQVWCNGAVWSSQFKSLAAALKAIGKLADRSRLHDDRDEWNIRIVKVKVPR
jgi:hypothetical protein